MGNNSAFKGLKAIRWTSTVVFFCELSFSQIFLLVGLIELGQVVVYRGPYVFFL
jgi:hypothetical protein